MDPDLVHARVNSIHHQGIKHLAPGFEVEAWSYPDRVPEAIRRTPSPGRGYIAATQWHPEVLQPGAPVSTVDDTAILHDFLYATQGTGVWHGQRWISRDRPYSRAEADAIFREAMGVVGVPAWRREVMYLAVWAGGRRGWGS